MRAILVSICVAQMVAGIAIINRLANVCNKRLNLLYNQYIVRVKPRQLFALFATYLDFHFAGDYSKVDTLPEQYLLLSNHQSLLDIPLYMRYLDAVRLRFVAKAELGRHVPAVSLVLRSDQHCLIRRTGSPAKAMLELDKFAERVKKNNWIPVLFPEGTRSTDGNLRKFHPAGFRRILERSPMPVVVSAVEGGWNIHSLFDMVRHLKGGFYRVAVVKVFPAPTNKAEQMQILEEGRALIQDQLDTWRQEDRLAKK